MAPVNWTAPVPELGCQAPRRDAAVLIMRQGRGLAGGADRHEAVDAARDLAFDESYKGPLVHRAVAERSHQGRHHALEQRI